MLRLNHVTRPKEQAFVPGWLLSRSAGVSRAGGDGVSGSGGREGWGVVGGKHGEQ